MSYYKRDLTINERVVVFATIWSSEPLRYNKHTCSRRADCPDVTISQLQMAVVLVGVGGVGREWFLAEVAAAVAARGLKLVVAVRSKAERRRAAWAEAHVRTWIYGADAEALKRVLSIEDAAMREEAFRNALESCDVDAQCDSAGILAALDETLRDVTLRGDAHEDLVEALQSLAEIAAEYDFGYSEPADDDESR